LVSDLDSFFTHDHFLDQGCEKELALLHVARS